MPGPHQRLGVSSFKPYNKLLRSELLFAIEILCFTQPSALSPPRPSALRVTWLPPTSGYLHRLSYLFLPQHALLLVFSYSPFTEVSLSLGDPPSSPDQTTPPLCGPHFPTKSILQVLNYTFIFEGLFYSITIQESRSYVWLAHHFIPST